MPLRRWAGTAARGAVAVPALLRVPVRGAVRDMVALLLRGRWESAAATAVTATTRTAGWTALLTERRAVRT
jgi:hypothetical protein